MDLPENLKPMLIGAEGEPFDSPDYIYELKLDGERCLAFLGAETVLRNKRNLLMLPKFPELSEIHRQVKKPCVLDGELMVSNQGVPDFNEVKRRSLMSNKFKIELAAKQLPASFVAFDILWAKGEDLTKMPLLERKSRLQLTVRETERLAVSRYVDGAGTALYAQAEQRNLEGIVAKRKDSLYFSDKRTKDWIKIKNLKDDDFVVCGYILKEQGVSSIVLGQYDSDKKLVYKGHVTLGVSRADFGRIEKARKRKTPPLAEVPAGNEAAIWLSPSLVCTVKFMEKNPSGSLRQPVFKGLRADKEAQECIER